jgi:hypothetical protein
VFGIGEEHVGRRKLQDQAVVHEGDAVSDFTRFFNFLFIGCGVGQTTIAKVTKTMLPFFGAMIVALMVITYVPSISLWLPVKTGQLKQIEVDKAYFMKTPD